MAKDKRNALISAKCNDVRCILRMLENATLSGDDVQKEVRAGLLLISVQLNELEACAQG
ncbi:hypothetical protein [Enterovibrio norvegicus]|uniref:hypothetical protein n=1 Tax=Enterovibrio norvegicus TaxID=188144 RepID=UPI0002F14096|nr:hypothetical protein [Enterovibrio norvegicus]